MTINYITKHEGTFEKKLMQGALTSILETPQVTGWALSLSSCLQFQ